MLGRGRWAVSQNVLCMIGTTYLGWECNLHHLQKLFLENPSPLCVASWPAKKNVWMRSWGSLRSRWRIIIRFWETAHLPLPQANINTYFSLRAKCWLRGGVGGLFPRNVYWLGMGQILSHPDSANLVNKDLLYSENKIFSRGTKRAIPSGQARAANRNVGFASSCACPPVEPALE